MIICFLEKILDYFYFQKVKKKKKKTSIFLLKLKCQKGFKNLHVT